MKNVFYKICPLKGLFLYTLGILAAYGIVIQTHVYAEGQTKYSKDFYDSAEPIKIKDPLAVVLGAMDKGEVFVFTYADAVKFAGHSCPAVAGAYKSTQLALKALYSADCLGIGRKFFIEGHQIVSSVLPGRAESLKSTFGGRTRY